VKVLTNTRPIYPAGVIAGESAYPDIAEIEATLKKLASKVWLIDATDQAVKLGNSILGNIIMIGAVSAIGDLPVDRDDFSAVISRTLPGDKRADNLKAFDLGIELLKQ
jgi:indolepyruvate ferredoxin oxidoreductase beta subunit